LTFPTSDLTPLLQAAPTAQMRYASGKIVAWNPATFENIVEVRGTQLTNLPVLAGSDALTFKAGDVVALVGADQAGARGVTSYAVLGRFVLPGAGKGEAAVEWMTTELGRAISAAVFADRVYPDLIEAQGRLTTADTWSDITFAGSPNPGPQVTAHITKTGRALVIVSARIGVINFESGFMNFRIDDDVNPPIGSVDAFNSVTIGDGDGTNLASTGIGQVSGLSEGTHTFKTCYRASNITNPNGVSFSDRSIVVMAF
jgi:hypothetical protein